MINEVRYAARVLHTARYLRPRQLFYQLRARLPRPLRVAPVHDVSVSQSLPFAPFIPRPESYLGDGCFRFLNHMVDLGNEIDWSASDQPMLWRYNLHYFDFLLQQSLRHETGWQLINEWIAANPPLAESIGWQPYPTSLRIVNWIKFLVRVGDAPASVAQSLALQTENLTRQIEYHLLGNHLFANAKALWLAGVFLGVPQWSTLGRRIVLEQLHEQFLPDGGHFELSPMYHAIALEDLLDLINLARAANDDAALEPLCDAAAKALGWLEGVLNADGTLPLLNDSANGIAAPWNELAACAKRLNVTARDVTSRTRFEHGWVGRNYSGYWVLSNGRARLLFDAAPLGPDYLPGHAHCDMLSILFDYDGSSILTDTGVFEYAEGPCRAYTRSTAAHNTVSLDDMEQAEIWKSFRVGRRGHPRDFGLNSDSIACAHDGFAQWQRGLMHHRKLDLLPDGFVVTDRVRGAGEHRFEGRYHFAPGIEVREETANSYVVAGTISVAVSGASAELTRSDYYPEFGLTQSRACLRLSGRFRDEGEFGIGCTFFS